MKQKHMENTEYARYSKKTQRVLDRCDNFLYENSRHIAGIKKFLNNLENDLLLAEAEMIIRNYERMNYQKD